MTDPTPHTLRELAGQMPELVPTARLVWTAAVDVAPREDLGDCGYGERYIVPITGGEFWGGPGFETLRGHVRAGGADRQWLRADGVKELHAVYEMETDDGLVLGIDNRVIVDDSVRPERYAMSHVVVTAPAGRLGWLNRRRFIGTLQPLRPQRQAVLIRVFLVER
ncbi:MAG: DUF3237 family protein [Rubrivivax sp.]|nr:DUF3237 family protein [Rubrivivax sp.]